ncbi:ROK family protein [Stieleria sp. JC731]|uniref:ROK family protein n=1 Tax=Pirellulaceae TaxID=2691357 RepID=UPI001E574686|nr:ROK family protein [Stieleria sp. JC731]MCC9604068.1 ROK family protein [Stieleria sp. JC731]
MLDQQKNGVFVAVDLGGTSAKIALANSSGDFIGRSAVSTQDDGRPDPVIDAMVAAIKRLLDEASIDTDRVIGLGMGIPGLVDVKNGVTKFLPNLPTQWRDIPVAKRMTAELGCSVKLLNDVRTATLGELKFGVGKSNPVLSFAFFSIGTGVGGGLVIDGQLRLGPLGAAGELGHQTIDPNGPRCGCGNRGCLETLASGPAITSEGVRLVQSGLAPKLRELVGGDMNLVTPQTMAVAASEDALVAEAIENAAVYLGIGAANVITAVHPDVIVLGGGVSMLGERLTTVVKREIDKRVGMFPTDNVDVVCSSLGADAGLRGAVALADQASREANR